MSDLSNVVKPWEISENFKKIQKQSYVIHMYVPKLGTEVHNKLENSDYVTNENKPYVLVGTAGEEWCVDFKKLSSNYTFEGGTAITEENLKMLEQQKEEDGGYYSVIPKVKLLTIPGGVTNWAVHVPIENMFPVVTLWGETLMINRVGIPHGAGDYLVCSDKEGSPDLKDKWVVNGEIFEKTYQFIE